MASSSEINLKNNNHDNNSNVNCNGRSLYILMMIFVAQASLAGGMVGHGVYFITDHVYQFSAQKNLLFAFMIYLPYAPGALYAGYLTRRLGGGRNVLLAVSILMVIACGWLGFSGRAFDLWIVVPFYNFLAGVQWPIVESYITAGHHGSRMRRTIGIFNMTWAIALCPAFWIVGMLIDNSAWLFAILVILHLANAFLILKWPVHPSSHDGDTQDKEIGTEYQYLLHSARILLPVSYVMMYALTPMLPSVWQRLDIALSWGAALSSMWMLGRVMVFYMMFKSTRWHGSWTILFMGMGLVLTGFIVSLVSGSVLPVLLGLGMFGTGQGLVYYSALYYGMAVGHAKVESGGMHEAVIGIGFLIGPALGLLGQSFTGDAGGVAVLIGGVSLTGSFYVIFPYMAARKKRRTASQHSNDDLVIETDD